jgi:hypothetical protein
MTSTSRQMPMEVGSAVTPSVTVGFPVHFWVIGRFRVPRWQPRRILGIAILFEAEMHIYRLDEFYRTNPKGLAALVVKPPVFISDDTIGDRVEESTSTSGCRNDGPTPSVGPQWLSH